MLSDVRYLLNFPIALVALSAILILATRIPKLYRSQTADSTPPPVTPQKLTSGYDTTDLTKLESNLIFNGVATNLLPPPNKSESELEQTLPAGEAVRVVEEFKNESTRTGRWDRARWWVGIGGALAWLAVAVARAVVDGSWRGIVLPVSQQKSELMPRHSSR
jgi:hypothetical protein